MTSLFHHLRLPHPHSDHSNDHGPSKKKDFILEHDPIGIGGYSQVIRAQWKARGGQLVAMKVVRKESIKDREQYLRILGTSVDHLIAQADGTGERSDRIQGIREDQLLSQCM